MLSKRDHRIMLWRIEGWMEIGLGGADSVNHPANPPGIRPLFEHRHPGAMGNFNLNRVVYTACQIIPFQCQPQQVNLDAHHGIPLPVEVRPAAEYPGCQSIFTDLAVFAGQRLVHNKFQKGGPLR